MTPVGMIVDPRQESVINLLSEINVLLVVPLHNRPRFRAPTHTVMPKGHALMFEFGAQPKVLGNVVEFV